LFGFASGRRNHLDVPAASDVRVGLMQRYQDFQLDMTRLANCIEVDASSTYGETPQAVQVAVDDRMIERLELSADQLARKELNGPMLLQYGTELGALLLPPEVRKLFVKALRSLDRDTGLRLRLKLRDGLLASLPWEFSYVREIAEGLNLGPYLSLDRRISIVRHELSPLDLPSVRPLKQDALRVLLVDARTVPGWPALADDDPRLIAESVERAVTTGVRLDLEMCPNADLDTIRKTLMTSTFDAVHFVGHAESRAGSGRLVLLDTTGDEAVLVGPDEMAAMLIEADVRIAVLAACATASRTPGAWSSLAAELVVRGLPAVIAMQHAIEGSHAAVFEVGLFEGLAAGLTLDEAVSLGRRRIPVLGLLPEWGVPVLYTRSDGVLFSGSSESESTRSLRHELQEQALDLSVGQRLEDEGSWDRAADFYGQCLVQLRSSRERAIANLRRGACLWRDGKPVPAEECFEQARDLARQIGDGVLLGDIYFEQGVQAEEDDRLPDAARLFDRAATEFVDSPMRMARVSFAIARLQARDGSVRTALETLRSVSIDGLPRDLQAEYWDAMGFLLVTRGDYDDAVTALEDALRLDEELGSESQIAKTRLLLARAYLGDGEHERAEEQVDKAIEAFERAGDEEGLSEAWVGLGQIYEDAGELLKALRAFSKANDYDVAAHDRGGEARVNRLLGRTARRRGDLASAEQYLNTASDLLRTSTDDKERAALLTEDALLDVARGEFDDARGKLERALDIAQADEDERAVAIAKRNLAAAVREMGDPEDAIRHLEDARLVLEQLDDVRGLESLYDELGECFLDQGRLGDAIAALKQSELRDQRYPNSREAARTQLLLGRAYMAAANRSQAEEHLERALEIAKELRDQVGLSDALFELGVFLAENGDLKAAKARLREALSVDRRLGDRIGAARCSRLLAAIHRRSRDFERAIEYLTDAKDELGQTSDRREKALLRLESAWLALARGRGHEAISEVALVRDELRLLQAKLEVANCDRVEALARASTSDYEGALALLNNAELTLAEANARSQLGEVYDELASVYLAKGDLLEARAAVERSLEVDQRGGWESSRGRSHLLRGEIERRSASFEYARQCYEQALVAFMNSDDQLGVAEVRLRMGDLDVDAAKGVHDPRIDEAVRFYREARALYHRYRDVVGAARCLRKLGEVFIQRKWFERAQEAFEQAEDAVRGLIDGLSGAEVAHEKAALALASGRLHAERGEHREAVIDFTAALQGFRALKRKDKENDVLRRMAASYQHLGEIDQSLQCIRQIGIEQARILASLLDYLDDAVGNALSGPFRDGDYRRTFDRATALIEQRAVLSTAEEGSMPQRLGTIATQWTRIADALATDHAWEPSSIDALSAAALAHLLVTIADRQP
jgi:tetratricopeptide (TPR) repeat protein